MEINERHRTYRRKGWEYILNEEDHTAWITKGRIGRCRHFRVHNHIEVDGVRYTITRIYELNVRWSNTLRHISIPDSVTYVNESVFFCFPNLRSIYLGSGVENFNGNHLGYNTRLSTIDISAKNPNIKVQNNLILSGDGKTLLCAHQKRATYNIPEGVERIDRFVFWGNKRLTHIELPESLRVIDRGAFGDNPNLRRIIVPEGVHTIGRQCFFKCENLEYAELPLTINEVGWWAFDCPSLKSLVINDSIEVMKNEHTSLRDAFGLLPTDCTIYVPYNFVEDYRDHDFWGQFTIKICQVGGRYDCDYVGPLDEEPEGDLCDMIEEFHHAFHEFRDARKAHPSAAKYLKTRIENGLEITYHDLNQWRKDEPDSEVFVKFDALNKMRDDIDLKIMHLNRRGEYPDMEGKIWV